MLACFDVDDFVIRAFFQAQAELFDTLGNHGGAAYQNGARQFFVHHNLHGTQDALALAFGEHQALALGLPRRKEDGAHDGARGVDELLQFFPIGVHIGDGARGNAFVGCGLGHGWRDLDHQARVKRFGDEVVRAEGQLLARVGGGNGLVLLGLRQVGNGMHGGNFHGIGNGGGPAIQRAAEDVGEAQYVIDLVGIVGAASCHDGIVAHGLDFFRLDFGRGVGQRKNQGLGRHAGHHVGFEHAAGRQAQEDVGAVNHFGQRALVGRLGVDGLVRVHQFGAAFVHHAFDIGDPNVLLGQAQLDQQIDAGQRRSAGAAGDQFDLVDAFAHNLQAVEQGRAHHNGGAVLVVVKDRDLHALAQLALDVKAVGRLDVFEVDAAEGWLQRGDDVHQLVGVFFVDFDIEHINAGKFLEQHAFAFHYRLAGQRADIAQAQHGRAVADNADQVAARGVAKHIGRVLHDFFTRRSHAGRIGQGQIVLVDHLLGGFDTDLARLGKLVVIQRSLIQLGAGRVLMGRGRRGLRGRHGMRQRGDEKQ